LLHCCPSASSAKVVERKERQSSDREQKIKVGMKAGFGERNRETYTDSEKEVKGPWC